MNFNWKLWLKGDNYRLDMGEQLLISDGKAVWKVLKGDKEVEVSLPTNGEDALNPKNIFTMYEKGFKNKYIKEGKREIFGLCGQRLCIGLSQIKASKTANRRQECYSSQ